MGQATLCMYVWSPTVAQLSPGQSPVFPFVLWGWQETGRGEPHPGRPRVSPYSDITGVSTHCFAVALS